MPTTWIVIAERSRARIFQYRPGQPLAEIHDLVNPAGRMQARELESDGRRRFYGGGDGEQSHSTGADSPALDTEAERFAREIARFLQRGHHERAFERLCLVAPPKFLGRLRAQLGPTLAHVAGEDIPHCVGAWDARELEPWLRQKGALRESLRPGAPRAN